MRKASFLRRGYATATSSVAFRGVFPPITTPFVADGPRKGEVDREALAKNVDKYFQTNLSGLVVLGSNGEFPLLSFDEKVQIFETVKEVATRNEKNGKKKKLLIAGTGTVNTRDTILLTKEAHRIGFDAAMVVTPYYFTDNMKDKMLRHHLESVATDSEIPILLYNVPPLAGGVKLSVPLVTDLAKHPNIVGIKDTSGNLVQIAQMVQKIKLPIQQGTFASAGGKKDFYVLAGSGSYLLQALTAGADGGIMALANIMPSTLCHLWDLYQRKEYEKAEKLQGALVEVNTAVTAQFGTAGAKRAMDVFGAYRGGDPRSPLLPLEKSELEALENVLKVTRDRLSSILPAEVRDW